VFLTGEIAVHCTQHGVVNFGTIHSGTTTLSGEYSDNSEARALILPLLLLLEMQSRVHVLEVLRRPRPQTEPRGSP